MLVTYRSVDDSLLSDSSDEDDDDDDEDEEDDEDDEEDEDELDELLVSLRFRFLCLDELKAKKALFKS